MAYCLYCMVINPQKLKQIRLSQPRVKSDAAYAQMERHLSQSGKLYGNVKPKLSSIGRIKAGV